MEIHYLDNAATTKVLPEAAQAALACMTKGPVSEEVDEKMWNEGHREKI